MEWRELASERGQEAPNSSQGNEFCKTDESERKGFGETSTAGRRSAEAGARAAVGKIDLKRAEQRQAGIIRSAPWFTERGKCPCLSACRTLPGKKRDGIKGRGSERKPGVLCCQTGRVVRGSGTSLSSNDKDGGRGGEARGFGSSTFIRL